MPKQHLNSDFLIPQYSEDQRRQSKDTIVRLKRFVAWLDENYYGWFEPDLPTYLYHLQQTSDLSPSSLRSYIAPVRARYRDLLRDPNLDTWLREIVPEPLAHDFIANTRQRFAEACDPKNTKTERERPKLSYLPLNQTDIEDLLNQPPIHSLRGLRDTAMIAVIAYMGLREGEVCGLTVKDLQQHEENRLALHVPSGRGCRERVIAYPVPNLVLPIVATWLKAAQINEGPVFRGFYRNYTSIRPTAITVQALEDILSAYPISRAEQTIRLRPFDLRRFNARALYASGVDLDAVGIRLGLNTIQSTLDTIGPLDSQIEGLPSFDLNRLTYWEDRS